MLSVLSLLIAPMLGETVVGYAGGSEVDQVILWQVRVPRVVLSFLCGAALALGGLVFQAMFRNALATPYTLGVASGSTTLVALSLLAGVQFTVAGISSLTLAALIGALLSITIVYQLAKWAGGFATTGLLLAGVILSFFFSSITMLVQFFADATSLFSLVRWGMGSFVAADMQTVWTAAPFILTGGIVIANYHKELDILMLGDDLAMSRGVEVERIRKILFIAVSFMVAGVISVSGPIGFVGIIVPHLCRALVGQLHGKLFWATILLGGSFLVWCDTLARSLTQGSDLPVGIITAILGGPFFIVLLLRRSLRY